MEPLLLLVFVLLLAPLVANSSSPALNDDVLGLIVFKADLSDPFSELSSWSEDEDDPCSWPHVSCDPATRHVTTLSLSNLSLSGPVHLRGLLRLPSLRSLSLSNNNLSGKLSPDILSLASLRSLDLSYNSINGTIPNGFFRQCRSLRFLSLAGNRLSGDIPSNVGSCSTLAALNLSANTFSGSLPPGIWSLNALRSLDLSENLLVGEIPTGIARMYNLRTISLRGNRFSGKLPGDFGNCLLLKWVDLGANFLSGEIPASLRRLTLCTFLSLSWNSFGGQVPMWIGEMKSLESLDFSGNWFTGELPDSLGDLTQLKELRSSGNGLSGSLPETVAGFKNLLDVDLSRNSFTGGVPSWVFNSSLQRILLSENKLSGEIIIPTMADPSIQFLDLSGNAFSGEVPKEVADIHGLKLLNLSRNSLSGSIPASIGELKALEILDLSRNQLSRNIPPEIGGAASLKVLRLEKNSLNGGIPTQIGHCSSLTSLYLSQNNLTGPLPESMANLSKIQTIDLSLNKLSGPLPKQLSDLGNLHSFNISHNSFTGGLPEGSFFNTISPSSLSNNPGLCGSVVNRPCPGVLPKPIVLNPNSSSSNSGLDRASSPENLRHKKIILSISTLVAIAAAVLIAVGVMAVTVLNIRVRSSASHSAAALALSEECLSQSPTTDCNSGKLIMFSGNDLEFSVGTHALLNKDCELGRGGFGAVYKTVVRDGRPVAIKKLTVSSMVKSQEDFESEVKKLGKMRHGNLVSLEGYYWTPSLQLLLYEFVPGGSLSEHLHGSSSSSSLAWRERFDIVLGVARSLAHLHRFGIIHYNLKSSNVLLDGTGEAKVGDYGLAKLLPMLDRYVLSSKIQSALGYMAPEFACKTVKITEKCDIYGFGVLLLEIVTGRWPVEYMDDDVVVLCDVVRGALDGGTVEECVDGRLHGCFPTEEAVPVIKLGLVCTSQVPSSRPDMAEVVNILEMIRFPPGSPDEELG